MIHCLQRIHLIKPMRKSHHPEEPALEENPYYPRQPAHTLDQPREVCGMRKSAPINVIVHYPTTDEGIAELARRVSSVHADYVIDTIRKLNCPLSQKLALLDAVIRSARQEKQNESRKKAEPSL